MFEEPAKPLCVGLLGTLLFFLMGHLIERAATYATEELHAERERQSATVISNRSVIVTLTLGSLLLLLIGIECTVERYGIIKAVLNSSKDAFGRPIGSSLTALESASYWLVAAIASVPFVLYHAYDARLQTRYRIAHSRRKQHFAKQTQLYLRRDEVEAVSEAVERVREAQRSLSVLDVERAEELAEARSRVAAIDIAISTHPYIVVSRNWQEQARMRATVENTPLTLQTKEVYENILSIVENDPLVKAARLRAVKLADEASILEKEAERIAQQNDVNLANIREASRAVARGVVQGISDTFLDVAAQTDHTYNGIDAPQTGQAIGSMGAHTALQVMGSPLPIGAQIAWQAGKVLADAIRSDGTDNAKRIKLETSDAENAAIRTLEEARGLLRDDASSSDPQIAHLRGRIRALKREVASFDQTVKNRVTQLRRQKQQYLADLSEESRRRIQDAHDQLVSAQALFEEELLLLERLVSTPRAARWFVAWRQTHANNAPMLKRIQRAQITRQLTLPTNK